MRQGNHDGANTEWTNVLKVVNGRKTTSANSVEHAILITLMDIREELRDVETALTTMVSLGPLYLRTIEKRLTRISANTHKPKRRRAKKVPA